MSKMFYWHLHTSGCTLATTSHGQRR